LCRRLLCRQVADDPGKTSLLDAPPDQLSWSSFIRAANGETLSVLADMYEDARNRSYLDGLRPTAPPVGSGSPWLTSAEVDGRALRFRAIYEANYDRILGYIIRRTEPDAVDDIVAETFTIAWRRLDDVPTGEEARLWLYGAARRVLANHERAKRRRDRLLTRLRDQATSPIHRPRTTDDDSALADAFARLPPADREILSLMAWEELDAGQIGRVLGCSRGAVRIRLHRARRRLVRELARERTEQGPARRCASAGGHGCQDGSRGASLEAEGE
jgi:RNA polymerase sigma-70 factor, ECF subfamily